MARPGRRREKGWAEGVGKCGHAEANCAGELAQQVGQGVAGDELAVVEDADARAQGLHFFHVMAGVDDGEAQGVQSADQTTFPIPTAG